MKNLLYMFAIWIIFNNGQIWKYPQANQFICPDGSRNWQTKTFELENSMSGKLVVSILQRRVKKIGFSMSEAWIDGKPNYHVYRNPKLVDVPSDDYNVVVVNGIRSCVKDKE